MMWIGYVCPNCHKGIEHHAGWNINCPVCGARVVLSDSISLAEAAH